jgi:hypothetical protein
MKKIIGYTDSVNECDCCGRTELKGTYCIELDGVELYYGSVCAFKAHGVTEEEKEVALIEFKAKKVRIKKEQELELMLAEGKTSDYAKSKVLTFVKKKGLNLVEFLKKNADKIEEETYYIVYQYGSASVVIDK